jgi:hypothetical protein
VPLLPVPDVVPPALGAAVPPVVEPPAAPDELDVPVGAGDEVPAEAAAGEAPLVGVDGVGVVVVVEVDVVE